jgi:hypothetical protein
MPWRCSSARARSTPGKPSIRRAGWCAATPSAATRSFRTSAPSAWITGDDDELTTLGAIASRDPWRGLHKVMNGQTYADMPAMRAFGLETVLDVLAYAQSLPSE